MRVVGAFELMRWRGPALALAHAHLPFVKGLGVAPVYGGTRWAVAGELLS